MTLLTLTIAIVALVVAVAAYQRAGGDADLRGKTAALLSKLEQKVRPEEAGKDEKGKSAEEKKK